MDLKVYAFTCGWLTVPAALLLEGETGSLTVPVPVYLIEHPKGCALLTHGVIRSRADAGVSAAVARTARQRDGAHHG